jgi:calcium/calmodulin-dependent protein kinase I
VAAEVAIHRDLNHPNVIRLFDIYETPQKIFLIMELVSGGELFDRIIDRGHFSEADASDLVRSIVRAVKYLHEKGIVHRDLKVCENPMIWGAVELTQQCIASRKTFCWTLHDPMRW